MPPGMSRIPSKNGNHGVFTPTSTTTSTTTPRTSSSSGIKRPLSSQENGDNNNYSLSSSKVARKPSDENINTNNINTNNNINNNTQNQEWDDELHREFVSAIFEIGMRNASPAVIMENMTQKPESVTNERIKSKLQKYRNNKERSKQEFLEEFDAFFQRAKAIDSAGGIPTNVPCSTATLLQVMGVGGGGGGGSKSTTTTTLLGGDAAAFVSFAIKKEREAELLAAATSENNENENEGSVLSTQLLKQGAMDYVDNFAGHAIPFPALTESEKKSSLGISMTFVMGLFLSMTEHITKERERMAKGQHLTTAAATTTTFEPMNALSSSLSSATATATAFSTNDQSQDLALRLAASLASGHHHPTGGTIMPNYSLPEPTNDQKLSGTTPGPYEAV